MIDIERVQLLFSEIFSTKWAMREKLDIWFSISYLLNPDPDELFTQNTKSPNIFKG